MVAPQKKKPRRFLRLQGSFSAIWVSVLRRLVSLFRRPLSAGNSDGQSKHNHRKSFQSNFADLLGIRGPEIARQAATGGCYRVLPRTSRADGNPATCSMVLVRPYSIKEDEGAEGQAPSREPVPFEIHDGYKGGFSVASERGGQGWYHMAMPKRSGKKLAGTPPLARMGNDAG